MKSTVHGVRYIFEPHRHWTERLWWFLAIFLSAYACGVRIRSAYIKWDQSPVMVTFADKSTPVWDIPFPAITICPETKVNTSMLNFTEVYHVLMAESPYNVSDEKFARMQALLQICEVGIPSNKFEQNHTTNIVELLREMAPTLDETFFACKFRNQLQPCNQLFKEVMTEEGLCFTFNELNPNEMYHKGISREFFKDNQTAHAEPLLYPYHVLGAGARVGLFVVLFQFQQHLEYMCRGPVQGFKMLLHTPGEVPQVSRNFLRIPLDQEMLVAIKPHMMTTSDGLLSYDPEQRQCFFHAERSLTFFKVYTQRNCELECLANYTMASCGCVKVGMPRNDSMPICGVSQMACYNSAEDNLLVEEFVRGVSADTTAVDGRGCDCLPACTSITYDAEISQTKFNWRQFLRAHNKSIDDFADMSPAGLSIYFKANQFRTLRRAEHYGRSDLIASCGGLLGLFMGASLLSIVDVIYYCTLRLCCNMRRVA